jgi:hypothetical protein
MGLSRFALADLTIEDERSLAHVAIYSDLKRWMMRRDVRFFVMEGGRTDHALLLNLAFWRPGEVAEVLRDDVITADQVAHNAWHALAADALGEAARSVAGLLLAESIASAFDIYLVGRLVGHAPESAFLATQVPAMAEAAFEAGLEEEAFEALLEEASREPEGSFESLRQLLFDAARELNDCSDVEAAREVLARFDEHPWSALLHHYELSTWVLFARCYGEGDDAPALAVDGELRAASDSIAWLEGQWLRATS